MRRLSLLALVAATTLFPSPVLAAKMVSGTASVIDGDTIEIHGQRIRLGAI